MQVHRLTSEGLKQFGLFLDSLYAEDQFRLPDCTGTELTEPIDEPVEIEARDFVNRLEAAEYLNQVFSTADIDELSTDTGIWSWLSLFYFSSICRTDDTGRYEPRKRYFFIPDFSNYKTYYRHPLSSAFRVYRTHSEMPLRAIALLCNPLDIHGDLVEQLSAHQDLVQSTTVMQVATELYYDHSTGGLKRGAGGQGPGSPRRLKRVVYQLDLTWDLDTLGHRKLIDLLPPEFDRFRE